MLLDHPRILDSLGHQPTRTDGRYGSHPILNAQRPHNIHMILVLRKLQNLTFHHHLEPHLSAGFLMPLGHMSRGIVHEMFPTRNRLRATGPNDQQSQPIASTSLQAEIHRHLSDLTQSSSTHFHRRHLVESRRVGIAKQLLPRHQRQHTRPPQPAPSSPSLLPPGTDSDQRSGPAPSSFHVSSGRLRFQGRVSATFTMMGLIARPISMAKLSTPIGV